MPVTRSASILASREATQPLGVRSGSRQEVIVLSDDEPSGTRHRSRTATTGRRRAKAKPKPNVVLGDVLEISSDDEPLPSSTAPLKQSRQSSALSQLQAQISMLQKENAELKKECSSMREKEKYMLDICKLEDHTTCDICAHRLWSPYILPDCGHTFCEGCLQDWFSKTDNESARLLRHFDINTVNSGVQQNNQPRLQAGMPFSAAALLEGAYNGLPPHVAQPVQRLPQSKPIPYTCPSCRTEVNSRPIENFALKAMVETVGIASGETSLVQTLRFWIPLEGHKALYNAAHFVFVVHHHLYKDIRRQHFYWIAEMVNLQMPRVVTDDSNLQNELVQTNAVMTT